MPYHIRKHDGQFCVENSETNRRMGCHDTEQDAAQHMRALHANVPDARRATVRIEGSEKTFPTVRVTVPVEGENE